jgi:integrase
VATVYKRGATWWVRFTWRGKEVRRSARTTSKAEAQARLARLLDEHRRLDRDGRPRRTYAEALARFEAEYLPGLKPATRKRYRVSLRQLAPAFGGLYLDEVGKARLAEYVSARKRAGTTDATIRRDLATLSCLCACAVAWDWLDASPVRAFSKRHLREAPPRTAYPSEEQVGRLVAHASPMLGRLILFLAQTGMRQEEACSLEWGQVSLPRREVRLTKTKTSAPRVVPLSDAALGTLLGTPRHPTSPHVFWHDDGRRYTRFANSFSVLARRAAVPFRCHDLRHKFASEFLQRTGDLAALQAILGHRTVTMTMRYAHVLTEHLHRAVARLAQNPAQAERTGAAATGVSERGARARAGMG